MLDYTRFGYDTEGNYLEGHIHGTNASYDWILSQFAAEITGNIVEVGSGRGTVTTYLSSLVTPKHLLCIEPEKPSYQQLITKTSQLGIPKKRVLHGTLQSSIEAIKSFQPDTFVYINVLEHIQDDISELKRIYQLLPKGGKVCIFVPALEQLYSQRDIRVGHYRRYYKNELERKLILAGFSLKKCHYFDFIGMFLWWGKFVFLRSDTISSTNIGLYNVVFTKIGRLLETWIKPPYGKNLIAIGVK